ncbi:hypothetical protein EI94DRAFT_902472 [Lactarius quietus]|nr:hypothetical protein EI94DRAFT_902472 [Lactarius quietus]
MAFISLRVVSALLLVVCALAAPVTDSQPGKRNKDICIQPNVNSEDGPLKLEGIDGAVVADGILVLLLDVVEDVSDLLCRIDRVTSREEHV